MITYKFFYMKTKITLLLITFSFFNFCFGQGIDNFVTTSQWNTMFPNRAGTTANHPQGYTTDFFSFANFKQALTDMSDYTMKIRKKEGVWGEHTTVTLKSTNATYTITEPSTSWTNSIVTETIINVDFADFLSRDSSVNNKRELAAFLANISKETTGGWNPVGSAQSGDYAYWGLYFVHEVGVSPTSTAYSDSSNTEYPPVTGQSYYGRGPIQLSWNYNYGPVSKFLFNDKTVLLNDPNKVQEDGVLAFKTGIWFWMTPQWPKPSAHQVMHNLWQPAVNEYTMPKMYKKGFGHTNNIINGGLECRSSSSAAFNVKPALRSGLYKYYLNILGFSTTEIANEDTGDYTTLCYESSTNAMENYLSANVVLNTDNFDITAFKMYPNPVLNDLTLQYKNKIVKIEVFNSLGQMIKSVTPNKFKTVVKLSELPTASYILKVSSNEGNSTFRIIKQ